MELYKGKDQEGGQESDGVMLITDGCHDVDISVLVIFRILYSI